MRAISVGKSGRAWEVKCRGASGPSEWVTGSNFDELFIVDSALSGLISRRKIFQRGCNASDQSGCVVTSVCNGSFHVLFLRV